MSVIIDDNTLYSRIAYRTLPLLMIAWLFAFIDRVNIGFAKLQMVEELGFSETVYGFGAGIFFLTYVLFEVPSNLLLHRIGARIWISRIMISWGLISAATMFVRTPWEFYSARLLLGAAEAGFIPGAIYYLSTWFPSHRRGGIFGVFYVALAGSGLVGGPLSGFILSTMSGLFGLSGWKWLLLVEAIPSLLVGVLILFSLPDRVEQAKWLTQSERDHVMASLDHENAGKHATPWLAVLRNPVMWLLIFIYFLLSYGGYGLTFWLPTMIQNFGVQDAFSIGLLAALPSLCSIVSTVLLGFSADRHRERRWHMTVMFLSGALGFCVSVLAQGNIVAGMIGLCLAAICMTYPSLFWAVPTRMLTGASAAVGIALINALGNAGGFVGPYIVGIMADAFGSTDAAVYTLAAAWVVSAALVHMLPSRLIDRQAATRKSTYRASDEAGRVANGDF